MRLLLPLCAALLLHLSACSCAEEAPPVQGGAEDGGLAQAGADAGAARVAQAPPDAGAVVAAQETAAPLPGAARVLSEVRTGRATFYSAKGLGACSLELPPGERLVAALNRTHYAGSAACGACAEVEGPKGTVRVRIVDLCPGCRRGDLDLSREAFARVAPLDAGRVPVRWRLVSCEVEGPLRYRFKEGSTRWWAALQVRNHRLPVQRVEWWKGGRWMELKRRAYNYFVSPSAPGTGPVRLRLTASDGQVYEDTLPGIRDGRIVDGAVQFR